MSWSWFCLITLVTWCSIVQSYCFYLTDRHGDVSIIRMKMTLDDSQQLSQPKLPIVQIILQGNDLTKEFIIGRDIGMEVKKLSAALESLRLASPQDSSRLGVQAVDTVYSDEMLQTYLQTHSHTPIVFKLYNDNCRRCITFEELFVRLAAKHGNWACFLQGRLSDLPDYTQELVERLQGRQPSHGMISDANCPHCQGSGKVSCPDCKGTGIVKRGEFSLFCPSCGGKKVIRCPTCGGKCLVCE